MNNRSIPPAPRVVLVVDDSLMTRHVVKQGLEENGAYRVITCESGAAGLLALERENPSLILLDYQLGDMRAPDFCQESDRWRPPPGPEDPPGLPDAGPTRILLISGEDNEIIEQSLHSPAILDRLPKPFGPGLCRAVVDKCFAQLDATRRARFQQAQGRRDVVATASVPVATARGELAEALERIAAATADARSLASRSSAPLAAADGPLPSPRTGHRWLPPGSLHLGGQFLPLRRLLAKLLGQLQRGRLHVALADEDVFIYLDRVASPDGYLAPEGVIAAITSNEPALYAQGIAFPFDRLDEAHPGLRARADARQREEGVPIFITAARAGFTGYAADPLHWQLGGHRRHSAAHRTPEASEALESWLRGCGHRAFGRAVRAAEAAEFTFQPLEELPDFARDFTIDFSLPQLLLESYRQIEHWAEIQNSLGDPAAQTLTWIGEGADLLSEIHLAPLELELVALARAGSCANAQEAVRRAAERHAQSEFAALRALYGLQRLALCALVPIGPARSSFRLGGIAPGQRIFLEPNSHETQIPHR